MAYFKYSKQPKAHGARRNTMSKVKSITYYILNNDGSVKTEMNEIPQNTEITESDISLRCKALNYHGYEITYN